MKYFILSILAIVLTACAQIPLQERIEKADHTLITADKVIPELVLGGDISKADAEIMQRAIRRGREALDQAQALIDAGLPETASGRLDIAVTLLRQARDQVKSEKAKQNIGRIIAALIVYQSSK